MITRLIHNIMYNLNYFEGTIYHTTSCIQYTDTNENSNHGSSSSNQ